MIYFTAHTFKCVCHCIRTMFRVLGMYNFGWDTEKKVLSLITRLGKEETLIILLSA